jgi:hypothetical protein
MAKVILETIRRDLAPKYRSQRECRLNAAAQLQTGDEMCFNIR